MRFLPFIFLMICSSILHANLSNINPYLPSSRGPEIVINNTVLAKVNGKAISVVDVVKRMDMIFYQQYPDYLYSKEAKYEFFQNSWAQVLASMIHSELIIADAQQRKVEISDGEVHKYLENHFGPNVIDNLEKANLSFDDAFQLVKRELISGKMLDMLQFKAIQEVTPEKLLKAYQNMAQSFEETPPTYTYQVFRAEGDDISLIEECLGLAKVYLQKDKLSPEQVLAKVNEASRFKGKVELKASSLLEASESELSPHYIAKLKSLSSPGVSETFDQNRFLFLSKISKFIPPTFAVAEKSLHQILFDEALSRNQKQYIENLRENFAAYDEDILQIPSSFQPFAYR